ncbi:hypothetical protein HELRODRAFT_181567 [Helobdella robusta]|uniref:Uncharacterized protein n=1 Tax=Helobdella robusta TaxID=6412 RepID=T1FH43_HELRO|nr:hypothetical protein HELRODRAFT_181567 [Helobdella robusta]ESN92369.1 hypothetical protein HELRODRAFT_181567 [Helobdella robusta]
MCRSTQYAHLAYDMRGSLRTVASLGLVSPGAVTHGVTPLMTPHRHTAFLAKFINTNKEKESNHERSCVMPNISGEQIKNRSNEKDTFEHFLIQAASKVVAVVIEYTTNEKKFVTMYVGGVREPIEASILNIASII